MTVDLLNNDDFCLRCGSCCGECEHLTEDKLCSMYSNRPEDCMSIEEKAALVGLPKYCGYWQEAKRRFDKAVAINQGKFKGVEIGL